MISPVPICGHTRARKYLERVVARNAFANPLLFSGPSMLGKRTIALDLVASFFCSNAKERASEKFSCGYCQDCVLINKGEHSGVIFFQGEAALGIDEMRELKRQLSFLAYTGTVRPVVIDNAERMTHEAQSSLLKILEEPARGVLFFLISSKPHQLLATVRSRLVEILFYAVDAETISVWAKKNFSNISDLALIIDLANGLPGEARKLLENRKYFEEQGNQKKAFAELSHKPLYEKFAFIDALLQDGRDRGEDFLYLLIQDGRRRLIADGMRDISLSTTLHVLLDLYHRYGTTNAHARSLLDMAVVVAEKNAVLATRQ